jgi:oxygen-dependent protoporphyrinogen oxidase
MDDQLIDIAYGELAGLLSIHGQPLLSDITRRIQAMPQYHVGHQSLVQQITSRASELSGFALASSALYGVGIPNCIHTGEVAAKQLASTLLQRSNTQPRI